MFHTKVYFQIPAELHAMKPIPYFQGKLDEVVVEVNMCYHLCNQVLRTRLQTSPRRKLVSSRLAATNKMQFKVQE